MDEIRKGPFPLAELAYILQDRDTEPPSLRVPSDEIESLLRDLRAVVRKAHNSIDGPDTSTLSIEERRAQAKEGLRSLLEHDIADQALSIIDRDVSPSAPLDGTEAQFFRKHLSGIFPDVEQAIEDLLGANPPFKMAEERLGYLLPPLSQAWARATGASLFFSESFGLPSNSTTALLHTYTKLPVPAGDRNLSM